MRTIRSKSAVKILAQVSMHTTDAISLGVTQPPSGPFVLEENRIAKAGIAVGIPNRRVRQHRGRRGVRVCTGSPGKQARVAHNQVASIGQRIRVVDNHLACQHANTAAVTVGIGQNQRPWTGLRQAAAARNVVVQCKAAARRDRKACIAGKVQQLAPMASLPASTLTAAPALHCNVSVPPLPCAIV